MASEIHGWGWDPDYAFNLMKESIGEASATHLDYLGEGNPLKSRSDEMFEEVTEMARALIKKHSQIRPSRKLLYGLCQVKYIGIFSLYFYCDFSRERRLARKNRW
jgi:hypothetical protein